MPMEDGVKNKPLGSNGVEEQALRFDQVGYMVDHPENGIKGVVNDRRVNNPVRRDKPYGR